MDVIIWDNISLYHKRDRSKTCFSPLSYTPSQKNLKCCWNDLKMSRSAGFQHVDLTKKSLANRTGRWKGNWKGIHETSQGLVSSLLALFAAWKVAQIATEMIECYHLR